MHGPRERGPRDGGLTPAPCVAAAPLGGDGPVVNSERKQVTPEGDVPEEVARLLRLPLDAAAAAARAQGEVELA